MESEVMSGFSTGCTQYYQVNREVIMRAVRVRVRVWMRSLRRLYWRMIE